MDSPTLQRTTTLVGITTSLFLSGVYYSSSQLTVPLLYPLSPNTSTTFFRDFYHKGIASLVPLTAFSAVCLGTSAYLSDSSARTGTVAKRTGYAVSAALVLAVQLWTVIVMLGVNNRLVEVAGDERVREKVGQAGVVALLKSWRWMNNVRAGMALVGGVGALLVLVDVL